MKNEQGNTYGMYSEIGWETRNNPEYRVDNYAFLFSLNKAKIYKAIKGKAHVCWIKNECGLWLFNTMGFYNNFFIFESIKNYILLKFFRIFLIFIILFEKSLSLRI